MMPGPKVPDFDAYGLFRFDRSSSQSSSHKHIRSPYDRITDYIHEKFYESPAGTKAQVDPDVIRALVLNIRYDGEKTVLTTGCAYQTFTMDKSADTAWDKALKKYLDLKGISYEEL